MMRKLVIGLLAVASAAAGVVSGQAGGVAASPRCGPRAWSGARPCRRSRTSDGECRARGGPRPVGGRRRAGWSRRGRVASLPCVGAGRAPSGTSRPRPGSARRTWPTSPAPTRSSSSPRRAPGGCGSRPRSRTRRGPVGRPRVGDRRRRRRAATPHRAHHAARGAAAGRHGVLAGVPVAESARGRGLGAADPPRARGRDARPALGHAPRARIGGAGSPRSTPPTTVGRRSARRSGSAGGCGSCGSTGGRRPRASPGSSCGAYDHGRVPRLSRLARRALPRGSRAGRLVWNVPDPAARSADARRRGAHGRPRTIGCGAVMADPLDAIDPDRRAGAGSARAASGRLARARGALARARRRDRGDRRRLRDGRRGGGGRRPTSGRPIPAPASRWPTRQRRRSRSSPVSSGPCCIWPPTPTPTAALSDFRDRLPQYAPTSWIVTP